MDPPINLELLPARPGIYKFKDSFGNIIYVGASKSLKKRVASYFQKNHDHPRVSRLVSEIRNIEIEIIDDVNEVFLRERVLISHHKPRYNVRWIDDKQYPLLMITTNEEYPRVQIVREKSEDGSLYFGRQRQVGPMRKSLSQLRRAFPICDCKSPVVPAKKNRPCLNYDLGLCLAPCAKRVSASEYGKSVENLIRFLKGGSLSLLTEWEKEMKKVSEEENFESASRIRDRIKIVQQISKPTLEIKEYHFDAIGIASKQESGIVLRLRIAHEEIVDTQEYFIADSAKEDQGELLLDALKQIYQDEDEFPPFVLLPHAFDEEELVFDWLKNRTGGQVKLQVFSRAGDHKWTRIAEEAATESLARHYKGQADGHEFAPNYSSAQTGLSQILGVSHDIVDIECIDISTLQGTATVASVVSFHNGIPNKKNYRKFIVRGFDRPNDFGSMKQVLTRHLSRKKRENLSLPDLLVLDGGEPQISAATNVLSALQINVPYLGIAKKEEEIVVPGKKERVLLPRNDPMLQLIIQLRDEAHRFANTFNRKKRTEIGLTSELEKIPGIGIKRRHLLLKHFSSFERLKNASVEELSAVPTISHALAERIRDYFTQKEGNAARTRTSP